MKNKEKFKDEIVDIVCSVGSFGFDIETNEPVNCNRFNCNKCLFYGDEFASCSDVLKIWSNQEYKGPVVISQDDIAFLNYIPNRFKYLARDKDGRLFAYDIEPKKYVEYGNWIGKDSMDVFKYVVVFPMIKWSDEQAWKISDLKKLKVVKNY